MIIKRYLIFVLLVLAIATPVLATEDYSSTTVTPDWQELNGFWSFFSMIPALGNWIVNTVMDLGVAVMHFFWQMIPDAVMSHFGGVGYWISASNHFIPTYYAGYLCFFYFQIWAVFVIIRTVKHFVPFISG